MDRLNFVAVARIVVVEDEADLATAVAARLRSDGHAVSLAGDGPGAVELIAAENPDVVILDLMLPGFDGLEVCRRIQRDYPVPVIMLTARGSETDRVVGLEVGADDYLCKPFSMRELTARVRALLRRVERPAADTGRSLRAGGVDIDLATRRTRRGGQLIELTATEFDLLAFLLSHPGVVRSREELLAEVWGYRDGSGPRTVDSHVRSVRRKVAADVIRTVHGVGYAGADGIGG
jgi:DNA-binding response OmpR family regulator